MRVVLLVHEVLDDLPHDLGRLLGEVDDARLRLAEATCLRPARVSSPSRSTRALGAGLRHTLESVLNEAAPEGSRAWEDEAMLLEGEIRLELE